MWGICVMILKKTTELYSLNEWIVLCVNYISIKLLNMRRKRKGRKEEQEKVEEEEEKGERRKTTWKSGLDDSILARDTLTTVSCHRGSLYLQTSGGPKGTRDPTPICSTSPQRMLTLPTIIEIYGSHY